MQKSSMTMTLLDRFLSLVQKQSDGCWKFLGPINGNGYGHLTYDGQVRRAHRVGWELHNGPIPKGLWVLHKCDQRWCVNPEHLFLGTAQSNVDDMRVKGRDSFGENYGERNGQAILTSEQVLEIRRLLNVGLHTQAEIGDMYGVTREAISAIKRGRTWRH